MRKIGRAVTNKPKMDDIYICPFCDTDLDRNGKPKNIRSKSDFYASYDPHYKTGLIPICKKCVQELAQEKDEDGTPTGEYSEESVKYALEYIDKPFIKKLWDATLSEKNDAETSGKKTFSNVFGLYMKNIQIKDYRELRWRDGDIFFSQNTNSSIQEDKKKDEAVAMYLANRKIVIRNLGYDPFENEPEKDKPFLYNRLSNMLDDSTTEDMFKSSACVEIVKDYNQAEKLNDIINSYLSDKVKASQNSNIVKNLTATKKDIIKQALDLAKDNGISVNNNKNASKGGSTLSGKMNYLHQIGYRNEQINMFDVDTCRGMQQVAEISAKAQINQIGLDENVVETINEIRREIVDQCQKERDEAVETARKLYVENNDLKHFLKSKGLIDELGRVVD